MPAEPAGTSAESDYATDAIVNPGHGPTHVADAEPAGASAPSGSAPVAALGQRGEPELVADVLPGCTCWHKGVQYKSLSDF